MSKFRQMKKLFFAIKRNVDDHNTNVTQAVDQKRVECITSTSSLNMKMKQRDSLKKKKKKQCGDTNIFGHLYGV